MNPSRFLIALLLCFSAGPASSALFEEQVAQGIQQASAGMEKARQAWTASDPRPLAVPECGSAAASEIARCIRDKQCHRTFVVAHRGNGFGETENSRAAMRKAVAAGVALIETDLRFSSDGQVFILHDPSLERTTFAKGRMRDLSSQHASDVRLRNGESLPRFEDIYAITRGKSVLMLHFKSNAVESVAEWLAKNGSFDDCLFFVSDAAQMASAARMKAKYPRMMVNARIHTWKDLEMVKEVFGGLPEVIHTDYPEAGMIRKLHALGTKVYTNIFIEERLWICGSLAIRQLTKEKIDFLQSDKPTWLRKKISSLNK